MNDNMSSIDSELKTVAFYNIFAWKYTKQMRENCKCSKFTMFKQMVLGRGKVVVMVK